MINLKLHANFKIWITLKFEFRIKWKYYIMNVMKIINLESDKYLNFEITWRN